MARTVMIVDDSMIMTQKLSVMVRDLGHQVVRVCNSGAEALRDYGFVKPDIVTMDITMPGMDGIETMTAIMQAHPHARVRVAAETVVEHARGQRGIVEIDAAAGL